MAWPTTDATSGAPLDRSHYARDRVFDEARAGQLVSMQDALREAPFRFELNEVSRNVATFAVVASRRIYIPEYARGTTLTIALRALSGASGPAELRILFAGTTYSSTAVINSASFIDVEVTVAVDDSWVGTTITADVELKGNGADLARVRDDERHESFFA